MCIGLRWETAIQNLIRYSKRDFVLLFENLPEYSTESIKLRFFVTKYWYYYYIINKK